MKISEKINDTKEFIFQKTKIRPEIAIVLGSGLGELADSVKEAVRIPYSEIPHFVKSTVEGHKGELVIGKLFDKNILIMQGRIHFYEGYSMQEITYPVRVMSGLGIKKLILTSAVGGINKKYKPGDIVLIKDHINFTGDNPLRGEHEPEFGERFPDMTYIYNREMILKTHKIAKSLGIRTHIGIYLSTRGPSYETPAEIKAFRKLGADVVGMSVVPEAIVAHQSKIELLCISYVSNMAAGILKKTLSHEEVIETGKQVSKKLISLLNQLIKEI